MATLIKFSHGLGDAVQLTVILQHLAKYRPEYAPIDILCRRGKETLFAGQCRRAYHDQEPGPDERDYNRIFELFWYENYMGYADRPNSKVTNCLQEVFALPYDPSIGSYLINVSDRALNVAASYLESIGCRRTGDRYNAVLVHYEGNTSKERKNLQHGDAAALCDLAANNGFVPVILDWDGRSPLPDNRRIFNPGVGQGDIWGEFGSGDGEVITALVRCSSLFVGIDSGPGKCASATDTPHIIVWTKHHPAQFHDLSAHTVHLVPTNHAAYMPHPALEPLFLERYRVEMYEPDDLTAALLGLAARLLGVEGASVPGPFRIRGFWCHREYSDQDWTIIRDVYLEDAYKTALIPKRDDAEIVVDVGAHIGTFARLWHERNPNARIICVEPVPQLVTLLRKNVGEFADVIQAACTYEPGELFLLDALSGQNCRSTGGSRVVTRVALEEESHPQYVKRPGRVHALTLDQIMAFYGLDHIDVLKLDCEESEYSILEHAPIERIGFILGEGHDWGRFMELVGRRFSGWDFGHMSETKNNMANFHLRNPCNSTRS